MAFGPRDVVPDKFRCVVCNGYLSPSDSTVFRPDPRHSMHYEAPDGCPYAMSTYRSDYYKNLLDREAELHPEKETSMMYTLFIPMDD